MSQAALTRLKTHLRDGVLSSHANCGDETAVIERSLIRPTCLWLRDTDGLRFDMLTDLTAVDLLGRTPRFEVVYHLHSLSTNQRLRLKVGVLAAEPHVDTVSDIWAIANWLEREVWDMYGIRFQNHPEMRRILLYEEFVGHPLRKDYPKDKRQPLSRRPPEEIAQVLAARPDSKRDLL